MINATPSAQRTAARSQARTAAIAADKLRREADAFFSRGQRADATRLYAEAAALDLVCDEHCAVAAAIRISP